MENRMESLVKKYLKNAEVDGNFITGYLESDQEHECLMRDIDSITGGFLKKWTESGKDAGNVCLHVVCTHPKISN